MTSTIDPSLPPSAASIDPPTITLPVDRPAALIRASWRLASAALLAAPPFLIIQSKPSYDILWQTQRAAFLAVAFLFLLSSLASLSLLASALRWLLLTFWPRPLLIRITPERIRLDLGPFGITCYPWPVLRITLLADIDPDLLDHLPDEALAFHITHPAHPRPIDLDILRFSNLDRESLTALLRPYLRRPRSDPRTN